MSVQDRRLKTIPEGTLKIYLTIIRPVTKYAGCSHNLSVTSDLNPRGKEAAAPPPTHTQTPHPPHTPPTEAKALQ